MRDNLLLPQPFRSLGEIGQAAVIKTEEWAVLAFLNSGFTVAGLSGSITERCSRKCISKVTGMCSCEFTWS